jgi:hypothetical protein
LKCDIVIVEKLYRWRSASRVLLLSPAGFYYAMKEGDDCGRKEIDGKAEKIL